LGCGIKNLRDKESLKKDVVFDIMEDVMVKLLGNKGVEVVLVLLRLEL